jgi:hypothetical protein
MAIEKVIDIKIQGNADEAVGSLRSQLRAAQADVAALSEKFGVTSQQAVEAAKKAGELKDRIGDAKALTDAFNPDAKFKALSSSLAGVAGGFAAVQGGMALLGVESESVEKTLLKVQSAMALSQGLQTIGESIDSFKQLSAVVQSTTAFRKLDTLATAAATVVQRLFSSAVTTTAVSFNALKTAIVSTGIGALVVGLGYLVAKMNESSDATEELSEKQKELNKQLEYGKELADANAKGIDYNTQIELAAAKQRGASDKELTQIRIDGVNARRNANYEEIKSIAATQKEGYNLTKEQNKRIQELRTENLDLERKGRLEIANFNADQAEKQREAEKKSGEEKTANTEKNKKEAIAQAQKEAEELLRIQQEFAKKYRDVQIEEGYKAQDDVEAARKANADDLLSEQELAIKNENDAYKIKYDNAVKAGYDTEELEIQNLNNLNDIKLKFQNQDYETEKQNSEAKIELAKKEAAAKEALMNKTASVLARGADLLGKNTAAGKAMAIAAATINTYQGITAELATKTVTPFEIGLKIANVALIAATGLKAVKDIVAVKVPGGGGGGGAAPSMSGGGGAGASSAPQFNVVGNSGVNQLAGVLSNNQQTPVKTYVVAQDVTSGQSLDRNIIQNASLG